MFLRTLECFIWDCVLFDYFGDKMKNNPLSYSSFNFSLPEEKEEKLLYFFPFLIRVKVVLVKNKSDRFYF